MPVRVLLLGSRSLACQGIEVLLRTTPGIAVAGVVGYGERGSTREAVRLHPDVLLFVVDVITQENLEVIHAIRDACSDANILVVSSREEPGAALQAVGAGAIGYLLQDIVPDDLITAVQDVASGKVILSPAVVRHVIQQLAARNGHGLESLKAQGLTTRELEVLRILGDGLSDREIAARLYLSEATVKTHLKAVYRKLKARNRAQAVALAVAQGIAGFRA